MAEPTKRSEPMQKSLDQLSLSIFKRSISESIRSDVCVMCGKPATSFRDDLSRKEFTISGLCQPCQDKVFTPPDEDEEP